MAVTVPGDSVELRAFLVELAEVLNSVSCFCGSLERGEELRDLEARCLAIARLSPLALEQMTAVPPVFISKRVMEKLGIRGVGGGDV